MTAPRPPIGATCPCARVIGAPYAALMRLRRWAYRRHLLPSASAAAPVICVGNLTTGGTGKTPMVSWVVRRLRELGRRPAVLTRGYKAVAGRSDEVELLRRHLADTEGQEVPVCVNPDRVTGAARAVSAEGADALVMDDGFSHLRLRRDLDIVLIDATAPFGPARDRPFGEGCCLPIGRLREPVSALRDAGAIVITRSDQAGAAALDELERHLGALAPGASLHRAVHEPTALIAPDGERKPLDVLTGRPTLLFSGIGNPAAFERTARRIGVHCVGHEILPDHARYTPRVLARIERRARDTGAEALLTTEKDAVKLTDAPHTAATAEPSLPLPVYQLAVEMRIVHDEAGLAERVAAAVGNWTPSPR